jgi:hypothetical protein
MASSILALKRFRLEDEGLYQRIDNQRRSQASPET